MEATMIEQLILTVFNQTPINIEKLEKGLTNQNFLVTLSNEKVVCRIPYPNSDYIVNYQHEALALQAVKSLNIDVPTLYFDEKTGIKITRYVEHCISFSESTDPNKYAKVGRLMATLHQQSKPIGKIFDPIATYYKYKANTTSIMISETEAFELLEFIQSTIQPTTLCHNDWVPDNILFTDQKDYLIDYEYAGDNDPIFDVTSFLSENHIVDPNARNQFLQAYFQKELSHDQQQVILKWEAFHHLLWNTWAIMMYQQRTKAIFQQIALDKFHAFKETMGLIDR